MARVIVERKRRMWARVHQASESRHARSQLIAEPGTAPKLGAFALNPAAMVTHGFGDLIRRRAYDRNTGALAELFAAPDSVGRMQAMAEAHHRSALADLFARGALQTPVETRSR